MAENLQLLSKTPHHHLLLPGLSAEEGCDEPTSAGALSQEDFLPWKYLVSLQRAYFASKAASTLKQYKTPA